MIDGELGKPKLFFGVLASDQLRQGKILTAQGSRHSGHPLEAVAGLEPAQFDRTLHGGAQLQKTDRFLEIIACPALERLGGHADGRMPGQNDDLEVGIEVLQRLHRLEAVHFRHDKIGKDDIELPALQQLHRVFAALRGDNRMSFRLQQAAERITNCRVVVDDQHTSGGQRRRGTAMRTDVRTLQHAHKLPI